MRNGLEARPLPERVARYYEACYLQDATTRLVVQRMRAVFPVGCHVEWTGETGFTAGVVVDHHAHGHLLVVRCLSTNRDQDVWIGRVLGWHAFESHYCFDNLVTPHLSMRAAVRALNRHILIPKAPDSCDVGGPIDA